MLPADVEGKVTHMTTTTGEYQVCISCASSKWFNTQLLKWSLSIELGDTDINIDVRPNKTPAQVIYNLVLLLKLPLGFDHILLLLFLLSFLSSWFAYRDASPSF